MLKLYFYECLGTLNFSGLLNASNFMLPCIKQHSHIRAQKFHSYIILLVQLSLRQKTKAEANQNNIFKKQSFPVFPIYFIQYLLIIIQHLIFFNVLEFYKQLLFILEKSVVVKNSRGVEKYSYINFILTPWTMSSWQMLMKINLPKINRLITHIFMQKQPQNLFYTFLPMSLTIKYAQFSILNFQSLTWQCYPSQKEIQSYSLFVLFPKSFLSKTRS